MQASSPVLRVALRVLTLQVTREELLGLDRRHLTLGLGVTWLVGIGRWWDDPGANLLQHLGLGSLAYVVALSLLLFGVLRPVAGADVTLSRVLTFVTLTAAPGLLYAIPVERFTALEVARDLNVGFLAVVATWRVAMLVVFARRLGQLSVVALVVTCLLPLTLIVTALTLLNLERAVLNIMGGLRDGTANDGAYEVLIVLTFLSWWAFVPLLVGWIALSIRRAVRARAARREGADG